MRQRAFGTGEVDQDVGAANRGLHVMADDDSCGAAEALAGVVPLRWRTFDVERRGEDELRVGERGLDQGLAHPASGAGDGEPDSVHDQGTGVADGLPIFLNQSMILPM